VNTLAAEVLYNKIAEIAEIDSNTNIMDVCCGTGTIGLSLAKVNIDLHNTNMLLNEWLFLV
jgi:16S rRNA G1207 methylase RsmC